MKKLIPIKNKYGVVTSEKCEFCGKIFDVGTHTIGECELYVKEVSQEEQEKIDREAKQVEFKKEYDAKYKKALLGSSDYSEFRREEYYKTPEDKYREAFTDLLLSMKNKKLPSSASKIINEVEEIKKKFPKP